MKNNIKDLIGGTPLIKITYEYNGKRRKAFFKAEWLNFSGSIKDRVAYQILMDAIKQKKLVKGKKIVEVTSGNMGISLSAVGKALGFESVIFMPKTMSVERQKLIKMYGAELVLTESFEEAFEKAEIFAKSHNYFLAHQFENESNILAHIKTAKEVEKQTKIKFKAIIAGVGTSGTLMGLGNYFKNKYKSKIVAVEPYSSQLLSQGKSLGHHKIQGLSDEIIPKLYNKNVIDKIVQVTDDDALAMADKLSKSFGFGVGISSGANFIGSVLSGFNNTLSVFSDDNKKYVSTQLSTCFSTSLVNNINLIDFEVYK